MILSRVLEKEYCILCKMMLNAAYQHIGPVVSFNSFQLTFILQAILQAASFQSTGMEFCVSHSTVISTCCMRSMIQKR
jgi:hypothetical protein